MPIVKFLIEFLTLDLLLIILIGFVHKNFSSYGFYIVNIFLNKWFHSDFLVVPSKCFFVTTFKIRREKFCS
jgi:hypothetical protein